MEEERKLKEEEEKKRLRPNIAKFFAKPQDKAILIPQSQSKEAE